MIECFNKNQIKNTSERMPYKLSVKDSIQTAKCALSTENVSFASDKTATSVGPLNTKCSQERQAYILNYEHFINAMAKMISKYTNECQEETL